MSGPARETHLIRCAAPGGEPAAVARAALRAGLVSGVLVPRRRGGTVVPALVQDPGEIGADAYFGAPIMPQNAASLLSDITFRPPTGKILAVLRSCEYRAAVELAKLKQVDLGALLLVGVDCLGATGPGYVPDQLLDPIAWRALMAGAGSEAWPGVRSACGICIHPDAGDGPVVHIGLAGIPAADGILLTTDDSPVGTALLAALAAEPGVTITAAGEAGAARVRVLEQVRAARTAARAARLAEWSAAEGSFEHLTAALAACTRCLNCRRACPLCYCRECTFETALFESAGDRLLARAARKGALRLPAEVLLYQLTRLAHVGLSCVACGMCEAYCPAGIGLAAMFAQMGGEARKLFDYEPGRDANEQLPLVSFREQELDPR